MLVLIIFTLLFPIFIFAQSNQFSKIRYPLEIAVVIDIPSGGQKDRQMWDITHSLPNYFELVEHETRIAVLAYIKKNNEPDVLFSLTGDERAIRNVMANPFMAGTATFSMKKIRNKAFVNARPQVQQIVLILSIGAMSFPGQLSSEAEEFRRNGGLIYAVYHHRDPSINPSDFHDVTANPGNVYTFDDISKWITDLAGLLAKRMTTMPIMNIIPTTVVNIIPTVTQKPTWTPGIQSRSSMLTVKSQTTTTSNDSDIPIVVIIIIIALAVVVISIVTAAIMILYTPRKKKMATFTPKSKGKFTYGQVLPPSSKSDSSVSLAIGNVRATKDTSVDISIAEPNTKAGNYRKITKTSIPKAGNYRKIAKATVAKITKTGPIRAF